MPHRKNFRVYFLLALLLIFALVIFLGEHRPSVLRPDLHFNAYISTSDGSLTVVDLASLRVINKIPVGPAISDLREHAKRPEIWGVSSAGGYVFVLNARTSQIIAKIPVGPSPLSLDFSSTGDRVYTTSAASHQLLAIDTASRSIRGRARTAAEPVQSLFPPDQTPILVANRRSSWLTIHSAAPPQRRASIEVIPQRDEVAG